MSRRFQHARLAMGAGVGRTKQAQPQHNQQQGLETKGSTNDATRQRPETILRAPAGLQRESAAGSIAYGDVLRNFAKIYSESRALKASREYLQFLPLQPLYQQITQLADTLPSLSKEEAAACSDQLNRLISGLVASACSEDTELPTLEGVTLLVLAKQQSQAFATKRVCLVLLAFLHMHASKARNFSKDCMALLVRLLKTTLVHIDHWPQEVAVAYLHDSLSWRRFCDEPLLQFIQQELGNQFKSIASPPHARTNQGQTFFIQDAVLISCVQDALKSSNVRSSSLELMIKDIAGVEGVSHPIFQLAQSWLSQTSLSEKTAISTATILQVLLRASPTIGLARAIMDLKIVKSRVKSAGKNFTELFCSANRVYWGQMLRDNPSLHTSVLNKKLHVALRQDLLGGGSYQDRALIFASAAFIPTSTWNEIVAKAIITATLSPQTKKQTIRGFAAKLLMLDELDSFGMIEVLIKEAQPLQMKEGSKSASAMHDSVQILTEVMACFLGNPLTMAGVPKANAFIRSCDDALHSLHRVTGRQGSQEATELPMQQVPPDLSGPAFTGRRSDLTFSQKKESLATFSVVTAEPSILAMKDRVALVQQACVEWLISVLLVMPQRPQGFAAFLLRILLFQSKPIIQHPDPELGKANYRLFRKYFFINPSTPIAILSMAERGIFLRQEAAEVLFEFLTKGALVYGLLNTPLQLASPDTIITRLLYLALFYDDKGKAAALSSQHGVFVWKKIYFNMLQASLALLTVSPEVRTTLTKSPVLCRSLVACMTHAEVTNAFAREDNVLAEAQAAEEENMKRALAFDVHFSELCGLQVVPTAESSQLAGNIIPVGMDPLTNPSALPLSFHASLAAFWSAFPLQAWLLRISSPDDLFATILRGSLLLRSHTDCSSFPLSQPLQPSTQSADYTETAESPTRSGSSVPESTCQKKVPTFSSPRSSSPLAIALSSVIRATSVAWALHLVTTFPELVKRLTLFEIGLLVTSTDDDHCIQHIIATVLSALRLSRSTASKTSSSTEREKSLNPLQRSFSGLVYGNPPPPLLEAFLLQLLSLLSAPLPETRAAVRLFLSEVLSSPQGGAPKTTGAAVPVGSSTTALVEKPTQLLCFKAYSAMLTTLPCAAAVAHLCKACVAEQDITSAASCIKAILSFAFDELPSRSNRTSTTAEACPSSSPSSHHNVACANSTNGDSDSKDTAATEAAARARSLEDALDIFLERFAPAYFLCRPGVLLSFLLEDQGHEGVENGDAPALNATTLLMQLMEHPENHCDRASAASCSDNRSRHDATPPSKGEEDDDFEQSMSDLVALSSRRALALCVVMLSKAKSDIAIDERLATACEKAFASVSHSREYSCAAVRIDDVSGAVFAPVLESATRVLNGLAAASFETLQSKAMSVVSADDGLRPSRVSLSHYGVFAACCNAEWLPAVLENEPPCILIEAMVMPSLLYKAVGYRRGLTVSHMVDRDEISSSALCALHRLFASKPDDTSSIDHSLVQCASSWPPIMLRRLWRRQQSLERLNSAEEMATLLRVKGLFETSRQMSAASQLLHPEEPQRPQDLDGSEPVVLELPFDEGEEQHGFFSLATAAECAKYLLQPVETRAAWASGEKQRLRVDALAEDAGHNMLDRFLSHMRALPLHGFSLHRNSSSISEQQQHQQQEDLEEESPDLTSAVVPDMSASDAGFADIRLVMRSCFLSPGGCLRRQPPLRLAQTLWSKALTAGADFIAATRLLTALRADIADALSASNVSDSRNPLQQGSQLPGQTAAALYEFPSREALDAVGSFCSWVVELYGLVEEGSSLLATLLDQSQPCLFAVSVSVLCDSLPTLPLSKIASINTFLFERVVAPCLARLRIDSLPQPLHPPLQQSCLPFLHHLLVSVHAALFAHREPSTHATENDALMRAFLYVLACAAPAPAHAWMSSLSKGQLLGEGASEGADGSSPQDAAPTLCIDRRGSEQTGTVGHFGRRDWLLLLVSPSLVFEDTHATHKDAVEFILFALCLRPRFLTTLLPSGVYSDVDTDQQTARSAIARFMRAVGKWSTNDLTALFGVNGPEEPAAVRVGGGTLADDVGCDIGESRVRDGISRRFKATLRLVLGSLFDYARAAPSRLARSGNKETEIGTQSLVPPTAPIPIDYQGLFATDRTVQRLLSYLFDPEQGQDMFLLRHSVDSIADGKSRFTLAFYQLCCVAASHPSALLSKGRVIQSFLQGLVSYTPGELVKRRYHAMFAFTAHVLAVAVRSMSSGRAQVQGAACNGQREKEGHARTEMGALCWRTPIGEMSVVEPFLNVIYQNAHLLSNPDASVDASEADLLVQSEIKWCVSWLSRSLRIMAQCSTAVFNYIKVKGRILAEACEDLTSPDLLRLVSWWRTGAQASQVHADADAVVCDDAVPQRVQRIQQRAIDALLQHSEEQPALHASSRKVAGHSLCAPRLPCSRMASELFFSLAHSESLPSGAKREKTEVASSLVRVRREMAHLLSVCLQAFAPPSVRAVTVCLQSNDAELCVIGGKLACLHFLLDLTPSHATILAAYKAALADAPRKVQLALLSISHVLYASDGEGEGLDSESLPTAVIRIAGVDIASDRLSGFWNCVNISR